MRFLPSPWAHVTCPYIHCGFRSEKWFNKDVTRTQELFIWAVRSIQSIQKDLLGVPTPCSNQSVTRSYYTNINMNMMIMIWLMIWLMIWWYEMIWGYDDVMIQRLEKYCFVVCPKHCWYSGCEQWWLNGTWQPPTVTGFWIFEFWISNCLACSFFTISYWKNQVIKWWPVSQAVVFKKNKVLQNNASGLNVGCGC